VAEARRVAEEKAAQAAWAVAEAERQAAEQASKESKVLKPVPGQENAHRPAEGGARVLVELAVHSPSNFYKGLGGNDVVDHGGVFVATYKIPKRGTAVALRVMLPGDLEFDADAIVQWTRETRTGDQHPGFGAQFTRISADGRGLVARYARKREPMFYDDL
jgi:Tfp pilus assembly protein PilZ